jgi:hypothetical protein
MDNFFSEVKRRNVYKVAASYGVAGWLIVQVAAAVAANGQPTRPPLQR